MTARKWFATSAGLVVAAMAFAARADEPVRLVWVRGENAGECASAKALRARVTARLGKDPFTESGGRSIEGIVAREGERWTARLYVRSAADALVGTRVITSEAADCAPLDDAVTLAIAIAIDPDAAMRPEAPSLPPPAPPAPAPSPAPAPPPIAPPAASAPAARAASEPAAPAPAPASAPRSPGSATLDAVITRGLVPDTAPGVALSSEISLGIVRASLGWLYVPEVRTDAGDFAFGLSAGRLGACLEPWSAPRASVAICASAYLGAVHGVALALAPTHPGERIWLASAARARFEARLVGPLALQIGAEILVPLARPRFEVAGRASPVYEQPLLAGSAFVGLGLSIP